MKGILLINLGSPKDLELSSIKDYLKEFLSDELVVDYPKLFRQILVILIIVPTRSKKTKKAYSEIWTEKGSPLINTTIDLGKKISSTANIPLEVAMRYQFPSIEEGMKNLKEQGCSDVFVIPLYPHYAMSTTLTTEREVMRINQERKLNLNLSFIDPFYNEEDYLDSLTKIITKHRQANSDYLLFSYHGIPNRHLLKTDPTGNHCLKAENCCDINSEAKPFCYKAQVIETSKLCANKLKLKENE